MRNDKLKNELNELPQDFDREQLWSSIELPKKKRKRRGFLWVFAAGVLLGGILWITIDESNPKLSVATDKHVGDNNTIVLKKANEEKSAQIPDLQNKEEEISSSSQVDLNFEPSTKSNANVKDVEGEKTLSKQGKNTFENDIGLNVHILDTEEGELDYHLKNEDESTNLLIEKNSHHTEESTLKIANRLASNQETSSLSTLQNRLNSSDLIKSVPSLPLLPFELFKISTIELNKELNFLVPNSYHDRPFSYSVSMFSLLGRSDHNFGSVSNASERQDAEKPLESFSIGIVGQKHLNQFELFTGISYSRHNTHLTQLVEDIMIVESVQNLVQREVSTQYSLYNSYQYVDIIGGIGYNLSLGSRWTLVPSVQIGYSLSFNAKGEIFDQDKQFIKLSEIEGYQEYSRWQGQANLKIARSLNENWEIGLLSYLTTRKSLGQLDSYSHTVSSYGLGLAIVRFIR